MPAKSSPVYLLIALLAGCQHGAAVQNPTPGVIQRPLEHSSPAELTARLHVKGMSCPLCANNIDKQLLRVPGVRSVSVDLGTGLVLAELTPSSPPTREQLVGAVERSGFTLGRIEMPEPKGGNP
jgi:copper chaperone CopZ